jgi:hypothetical protein
MRLGLAAACVVVIGIGSTAEPTAGPERMLRLAQATVVTPTTPATTSTLPQTTARNNALLSCFLNCDTGIGACQATCNRANSLSPTLPTTVAAPVLPTRPDAGALAQCFINCSQQQLTCKAACAVR